MIQSLALNFPYWGIFLLIILGGLGLPFPEDLILLLAGQLSHSENLNVFYMILICFVAVIPTDYLLYFLGKKYGRAAWRARFVRRIMTPQRRVFVMNQFKKRGDIVVFIARFIGGFRAVTFVTAGILKMSTLRFLLLDISASLLSIPLFVLGAYYLGQAFSEGAREVAHQITIYLMIFIAVVFVIAMVRIFRSNNAQ